MKFIWPSEDYGTAYASGFGNYSAIAAVEFYDIDGKYVGEGRTTDISITYDSIDGMTMDLACIPSRNLEPYRVAIAGRASYVDKVKQQLVELNKRMRIVDVIFHDPATIVFWMDGSKTVVKCQEGEKYDPEKGLAMAISKKAAGNNGNYYNEFRKWLSKADSSKDNSKKGAR